MGRVPDGLCIIAEKGNAVTNWGLSYGNENAEETKADFVVLLHGNVAIEYPKRKDSGSSLCCRTCFYECPSREQRFDVGPNKMAPATPLLRYLILVGLKTRQHSQL